jgi:hypothetical protein
LLVHQEIALDHAGYSSRHNLSEDVSTG